MMIVLESTAQAPPWNGVFEFQPMERVRFGPGAVQDLVTEVARHGAARVFIVTGTTLATKTPYVERLAALLGDRYAGEFHDTRQHVPRETVLAATQAARAAQADLIISLGGGSPNDTAKMVALCLAADIQDEGELDRYRLDQPDGVTPAPIPDASVPHIAIPTTLSAGEFTLWAGVTDVRRGTKDPFGAPHLTPVAVFLDPEVTIDTPAWLWGTTGLRALDHAVETLCSVAPQPLSDALSRFAIETLGANLVPSVLDPTDLAARGACQVAAWASAISLPNVPVGLSHGIGHQLGARCGVPHGVCSAIVLPAVLDFNRRANARQQATVAAALGVHVEGLSDEAAASAAAARIREMVSEMGVDARLSAWGVERDDLALIATDSLRDFMTTTNPRRVSSEAEVSDLLAALL